MNYWITSHWPPHQLDFPGRHYYGIWLQDGKRFVGEDLRVGDLVFKYETQSGQARIADRDGKKVVQQPPRGRMGIVALMEVTSELYENPDPAPTEYENGSTKWWRYKANADAKDPDGFLPLRDLSTILGFSDGYRMRGFGDANSGLKRIDKATFDAIYSAFKAGG